MKKSMYLFIVLFALNGQAINAKNGKFKILKAEDDEKEKKSKKVIVVTSNWDCFPPLCF